MSNLVTVSIPLPQLCLSENNIRIEQKERGADFDGLVQSIKANGIIVPLVVAPQDSEKKHPVLDGGRRLKALNLIHVNDREIIMVPCQLTDITDPMEQLALSTIGNHNRKTLSPEEYNKYLTVGKGKGWTQRKIAAQIGVTPSTLSILAHHGSFKAAHEAQKQKRIEQGTKVIKSELVECPHCHKFSSIQYTDSNQKVLVPSEMLR